MIAAKFIEAFAISFSTGCVFLCLATTGCANHPVSPPPMATKPAPENRARDIGERFVLHSKILKEDRPYLVCLPPSYDSRRFLPQKYPVLYLLDGDAHLPYASGVVRFLSDGNFDYLTPEMIIVAIPNTDRTRDLTPTHSTKDIHGKDAPGFASSGGGDKFLDFLQEELIPHVEAEYRTQPYRILVGHSVGGLLAIHAMMSRPQLFHAYLAMDPGMWWDNGILARRAEAMKTNEFHGMLYISMANGRSTTNPVPTTNEIVTHDFVESLRTNSSPAFRVSLQYFDSEDHGSVPLLSLYHGLRFIFGSYKSAVDVTWYNPGLLSADFRLVSERLGYAVLPPEQYVDELGSWQLDSAHDTNAALACFQLNVSNYPGSFNAWQSLGGAFKVMGDKDSALKCFTRSLELNPDNRDATEQIRKLKPAPFPKNAYTLTYEAECGHVGTNWQILTDANASNGKYVTITPGLNSTAFAPTNRYGDWIAIPVSLTKSGTFAVFARCNNPTGDDDSFWLSVDNGPFKMLNNLVTSGWEWVSLGTYTLARGAHTLTIGYREDGATLDKISISDYPLAPPGMGQPAGNICDP